MSSSSRPRLRPRPRPQVSPIGPSRQPVRSRLRSAPTGSSATPPMSRDRAGTVRIRTGRVPTFPTCSPTPRPSPTTASSRSTTTIFRSIRRRRLHPPIAELHKARLLPAVGPQPRPSAKAPHRGPLRRGVDRQPIDHRRPRRTPPRSSIVRSAVPPARRRPPLHLHRRLPRPKREPVGSPGVPLPVRPRRRFRLPIDPVVRPSRRLHLRLRSHRLRLPLPLLQRLRRLHPPRSRHRARRRVGRVLRFLRRLVVKRQRPNEAARPTFRPLMFRPPAAFPPSPHRRSRLRKPPRPQSPVVALTICLRAYPTLPTPRGVPRCPNGRLVDRRRPLTGFRLPTS